MQKTWRRIVNQNENICLAKITTPLPTKIKWLHEEFDGRVRAFGGADTTILLSLANGAAGLTVAGANVVPRAFAQLFESFHNGGRKSARCGYYRTIAPLSDIAVPSHTEFIQCYKQALYWMGVIDSPHTRGPMMLWTSPGRSVRGALEFMGVEMVR